MLVWLCYLCFLGNRVTQGFHLFQEVQESLFDLDYQASPSAHQRLQKI